MIELLQRMLQAFIEAIKNLLIALAIAALALAVLVVTFLRFALLALSQMCKFLADIMAALFRLALIALLFAASIYATVNIFEHYQGNVIEKSILSALAAAVPALWALFERKHTWGALAVAVVVIAGIGYAVSVLDIVAQALVIVATLAFFITREQLTGNETSQQERTSTNGKPNENARPVRGDNQDRNYPANRFQDN